MAARKPHTQIESGVCLIEITMFVRRTKKPAVELSQKKQRVVCVIFGGQPSYTQYLISSGQLSQLISYNTPLMLIHLKHLLFANNFAG